MSTEHRSDPDTGEFAVSRTNSPESVGHNNPEAGPVETPNFYGTGTDDLRAGTGKTDAPAPGMPQTESRADPDAKP